MVPSAKSRSEVMPRFYIPSPHVENGLLRIEGDEVRHIRKVLRLKAGDEILVFDGLGRSLREPLSKRRAPLSW